MITSQSHALSIRHLFLFISLFSACGDSRVLPSSDGAKTDLYHPRDGQRAEGTSVDKTITDGRQAVPCPSALPEAATACPRDGQVCEYGDNPRCLSSAECSKGKWTVTAVKCQGPDPTCPATIETASGQTCSSMKGYCIYAGIICECTNCIKYPVEQCQGPLKWDCESPNQEPSCPAARPNLGTSCTVEGTLCLYGCEPGVSRQCEGGAWVAASSPGGCPISTRRAKKDIHYLSSEELQAIAASARSLRLATYKYRDSSRGGRSRLGYILEDSPSAISSDLSQAQVDLYAYASMILALAQQQQQEISALKRHVKLLSDALSTFEKKRTR
jgi:hypothetical protein